MKFLFVILLVKRKGEHNFLCKESQKKLILIRIFVQGISNEEMNQTGNHGIFFQNGEWPLHQSDVYVYGLILLEDVRRHESKPRKKSSEMAISFRYESMFRISVLMYCLFLDLSASFFHPVSLGSNSYIIQLYFHSSIFKILT
jgi:hypothetical protein